MYEIKIAFFKLYYVNHILKKTMIFLLIEREIIDFVFIIFIFYNKERTKICSLFIHSFFTRVLCF